MAALAAGDPGKSYSHPTERSGAGSRYSAESETSHHDRTTHRPFYLELVLFWCRGDIHFDGAPPLERQTSGMLHTWKTKPRNKTFTPRARCRAIFWVPQLPCASMAAQAALTAEGGSWPTHVTSVTRVCSQRTDEA